MNTYISRTEVHPLRLDRLDCVQIKNIPDGFCAAKTFDCGQCFRFDPVEKSPHEAEYSGVVFGRAVSFASDGDDLTVYNCTERDFYTVWEKYLGLCDDYGKINADILSRSDKAVLADAVKVGRGIRILSQPLWETLCSFIISQNNNIPRIKKIIANMSRKYGDAVDATRMEGHLSEAMREGVYSFPSAERLYAAGEGAIFDLRTGFRAKYIFDAAKRVSEKSTELEKICLLDSAAAAQELMKIKGVGPKVAACTLLFGFSKYDAFPIDVWIKRVMAKYFPTDFTPESLGPYAGVAQQYLFYYERFTGGKT